MFRPSENIFDADRKLCGRTLADSRTPAKQIPPRTLPIWELSSEAFLVYIAAILFYEPIFTQPLGFGLCAAGAVEKPATDGTVSVVYLRDSIGISKINAAFLTGQQIDRIHVQQLLLKCFERDVYWTSIFVRCLQKKRQRTSEEDKTMSNGDYGYFGKGDAGYAST